MLIFRKGKEILRCENQPSATAHRPDCIFLKTNRLRLTIVIEVLKHTKR